MKNIRKSELRKESFIRWQSLTIEELGKRIDLLIGFSVAILGYQLSLLADDDFEFGNNNGLDKFNYFLSVLCFLLSAAIGLVTSFNRLVDFRLTTRLINLKRKKEDRRKIIELDKKVKDIGNRTWKLFAYQISSFGAGIIIFTAFILLKYSCKIF